MFNRRSLTWTAIVLFILIVGLQASSYLKIANSIKDDPIVVPSDSLSKKPLPASVPVPTDANGVHVQTYKRDYTTVWIYTMTLLIIYGLLSMLQRYSYWLLLQQRLIKKDRRLYCHFRYLFDYEFRILDSTWSLNGIFQLSGLVLINCLFIVRHRVLVQELEGGRDLFHQEYANRAAQLGLVNISAAVALSVRNIIHTSQFGTHKTLAWHAWFGRIGGLCALYHSCFQFARKYYRYDYDGIMDVLFSNVRYTTGTLIIIAMFVLYVGSHPLMRTLSYRFFRVSHVLAFLTIVLVGGFHHWIFIVFYAAVVCIWFTDQFKLSWPARLISVKALPSNIVRLQLEPSFTIDFTSFIPGQFTFVTITGGWLSQKFFSHPFSISRFNQGKKEKTNSSLIWFYLCKHILICNHGNKNQWTSLFIESPDTLPSSADGPLLNDEGTKAIFTFYIKANGRHTASLYQIAESGDTSCLRHMRISKPLGKPMIDVVGHNYGDFEVVVLVAEGIGITPWISVLQQLGRREHHVQTKHIVLIWSIRSIDTLEAFLPQFQSHLTGIDCTIKVFITREETPSAPPLELEEFTNNIVLQLTNGERPNHFTLLKEIQRKYPTNDIALGICAHDETIQQCGNIARGLSNEQSIWSIRCERFEF
ncbi:hypothetical protein INT45_005699 [Circinella minor]|uniref:FAD-binding FR-type domain-containing protein n=1 Tax=Circinella minor TaxID=1195481 RepID=A0A8H7S6V0_9FUNG|nr:hypothetical protein INT45_005699 [Circinella minor]